MNPLAEIYYFKVNSYVQSGWLNFKLFCGCTRSGKLFWWKFIKILFGVRKENSTLIINFPSNNFLPHSIIILIKFSPHKSNFLHP